MRALAREPLVHFLVGGAALFLLYSVVAKPGADLPDRIVVSEDRVAMLARSFERTWMRQPTASELEGLIDDYVTEEVLYREALALGLDRDDLVVRRRMRLKMDFLNDGLAASEPTEAELSTFLEANPAHFHLPLRLSFVQVFVNPESGSPEARAEDLLARLRAGEAPDALGDSTLLPQELSGATWSEVADTFGVRFADDVADASQGTWSGPLASSFGLHLVRLDALQPGRLPSLQEARAAVEREWRAEQRGEARERFYDTMRGRYDVEVSRPSSDPAREVAER